MPRKLTSALKSVPSLAQRAPSSVTLRFAQGKPSVHHLRTVVLRQLSALSPQLSALKSLPPLLDKLQFAAIDKIREAITSQVGIKAFGL